MITDRDTRSSGCREGDARRFCELATTLTELFTLLFRPSFILSFRLRGGADHAELLFIHTFVLQPCFQKNHHQTYQHFTCLKWVESDFASTPLPEEIFLGGGHRSSHLSEELNSKEIKIGHVAVINHLASSRVLFAVLLCWRRCTMLCFFSVPSLPSLMCLLLGGGEIV